MAKEIKEIKDVADINAALTALESGGYEIIQIVGNINKKFKLDGTITSYSCDVLVDK